MTYLWPDGDQIVTLQCHGTTKRGLRCRIKCLGTERETYWCPRHIDQKPPVPGRIIGGKHG